MGSAGLRRWTRRFAIASAGSFVAFLLVAGIDRRLAVLVGVFGFVCPMIFGMAYLLLPPYAGETLVDHRIAGVHVALAYAGGGLIVADRMVGDGPFALGAVCWALGVAVFVGSLLVTAGPALADRSTAPLRSGDRPQRSTRLATATIPVAVGYLVAGTVGLLASAGVIGGSVALPQVVHVYAVGFGALLVFALGARLLIGFFHVEPPRSATWIVLPAGALAPAFLGAFLWVDPWFRVGAVLAAIAMTGYLALVVDVARRTDRRRVGLSGIVLGAVAGAAAVAASLAVVAGPAGPTSLDVHVTLVLAGFFPLTIVGYAYLFFPVTGGRFPGASARSARATIGCLGAGAALQAVGILAYGPLRPVGIAASVLGALGYAYLLGRRFATA